MTILEAIFATKAEEIATAKKERPFSEVEAAARNADAPRGFRAALVAGPQPSLIAEVKKASPSEGLIRPDFDPVAIAATYRDSGASCLSVLTDERYFQGSWRYLVEARAASGLPVLRKDFICDPYQVYEARAWGADAILLIVASLSESQLRELHGVAFDLVLDVLVEVHDEAETETALAIGADLIGVNNRDLRTFKTDLSISERLIPRIKPYAVAVSESALNRREDVERVAGFGARSVLIGTAFCRKPDIAGAVSEIMPWA